MPADIEEREAVSAPMSTTLPEMKDAWRDLVRLRDQQASE
jgi:hypothetical protein